MPSVRRLLRRGALAAVAVPALSVPVLFVSAPSASAATKTVTPPKTVTCSGESCTGRKPELTGCDKDGQTIRVGQVFDTGGRVIGTIELRWSAACQSNWARVTSRIGVQPLSATVTRDDARSTAANFRGTRTWSPMVWVGATGKAVATGWIGRGSGSVADGVPNPGGNFR